jgi:phospholipid transport system transporter-binding protein
LGGASQADGADASPALTGPATLAEAPRLKEVLLSALAGGGPIRVDLAEAGPWDVAGLQLLIAAEGSARGSGRDLRLVRVPQALREAAARAGLTAWLEGLAANEAD